MSLLLALSAPEAEAQISREYQLKAVFIYNFAQFTEWPPEAFAGPNSPLVIGVMGNNPFGGALEETIHGETINGRPLIVEQYRRGDDIKTCHILFIGQSEIRHMDEILKSLKGKPVLTVTDTDTPQTAAAIIRFVVENNKIHFRINQDAARDANIVLSSRLLRVADVPPPEKNP